MLVKNLIDRIVTEFSNRVIVRSATGLENLTEITDQRIIVTANHFSRSDGFAIYSLLRENTNRQTSYWTNPSFKSGLKGKLFEFFLNYSENIFTHQLSKEGKLFCDHENLLELSVEYLNKNKILGIFVEGGYDKCLNDIDYYPTKRRPARKGIVHLLLHLAQVNLDSYILPVYISPSQRDITGLSKIQFSRLNIVFGQMYKPELNIDHEDGNSTRLIANKIVDRIYELNPKT